MADESFGDEVFGFCNLKDNYRVQHKHYSCGRVHRQIHT